MSKYQQAILKVDFGGKRALISGGSKGLGRELVARLLDCNAEVFALARNEDRLKALKADFPKANIIKADLDDVNGTRAEVKGIRPIHLLVNCAALNRPGSLLDAKVDDFDATMRTNVRGHMNVTQIVAEDMIKRQAGGSILTISSVAGRVGIPNQGVYCLSKAALGMMTRCMAVELGPYNIRCNSVNPGLFPSDMSREMQKCVVRDDAFDDAITMTKMQHELTLSEVCNNIIYLLSNMSPGITGQSLYVCAGFTAHTQG